MELAVARGALLLHQQFVLLLLEHVAYVFGQFGAYVFGAHGEYLYRVELAAHFADVEFLGKEMDVVLNHGFGDIDAEGILEKHLTDDLYEILMR